MGAKKQVFRNGRPVFLARLTQRAAGSQPVTLGLCGCAFNTHGVAARFSLPQ
jgi:hypothetical protein